MNYPLSRRSFLNAASAIALGQMLSGCSNSEAMLQILFLENSIPLQLIGDFRKTIVKENKIDFKPQTQLYQIFNSLLDLQKTENANSNTNNLLRKVFGKTAVYPKLTSLGDFWLSSAIKQNLIQPLSVNSLENWQKLPTDWQKLVQYDEGGNITTNGQIYGAPYRWGSTIIAYRSDKLNKLGLTTTDWQDLWQPELRDRLSLLDTPREVIGLTLKKLGHSYNANNLDSIADLETELSALDQQVKLYSSDNYLEPLILGDTWVAVGWSSDILPLLKRYQDIKIVIPRSGTSLWADLWVKPRIPEAIAVANNDFGVIEQWMDFCWQAKSAIQISLFTNGISPILSSLNTEELPQDLQGNVFVNSEVLNSDKSEFLQPLPPKSQQQYRDLWLKIRQA